MEGMGEEFLREIEPCLDVLRSIDLRVIAFEDSRIGWRCESIRATLLPDETIPIRGDLPKIHGLLAVHEVWPIGRIPDLISMLLEGELILEEHKVVVKAFAGNDIWRPYSGFWIRTHTRDESYPLFGMDWSTIVLQAGEGFAAQQGWQRYREIMDQKLADHDPPWNGMSDLRRSFLGQTVGDAQRYDLSFVHVVVPLPMRFGPETSLTDDELVLDIETVPELPLEHAAASAFFAFGDEIVGRTRDPIPTPPRRMGPIALHIPVPAPCSGALCYLLYRGIAMDRRQVFRETSMGGDPHWSVFSATVGGAEALSRALRTADGGDPFEHAVAALLQLLGLKAGHDGKNTFGVGGDMVDIVAIPPAGKWCLAVECTIRELEMAGKISKLFTRAKELGRALQGYTVHPVVVTRQPRADIPATALEDAARDKIAVVTLDDLDALVQLATEVVPPENARDHLLGLIPSRSKEGG